MNIWPTLDGDISGLTTGRACWDAVIRLKVSPKMLFWASVILFSLSEPVSSCMAGGACTQLLLIGGDDDELAPVEESRCGDERIC